VTRTPPLAPLLLLALPGLACTGSTPTDATDPPDTDVVDTDTDVAWSPPPAGPFQFEIPYGPEEQWTWTVDAVYFPASKPERPAVLLVPGGCLDDWPDGMEDPFIERDWAVIVSDRVGCKPEHGHGDEIRKWHRPVDLLVRHTRRLRADGYGPLTVIAPTLGGLYWTKGRDPDVPQMKVGVQFIPRPNLGTTQPLSTSLPLQWLLLTAVADQSTFEEHYADWYEFHGGPHPEWTWWWDRPFHTALFTDMVEGHGPYEGEPDLFDRLAAWLEPHLEEAYQAGPEAWEEP